MFTNNSQKYWELLVKNASESAEGKMSGKRANESQRIYRPKQRGDTIFFHLINLGRCLGLRKLRYNALVQSHILPQDYETGSFLLNAEIRAENSSADICLYKWYRQFCSNLQTLLQESPHALKTAHFCLLQIDLLFLVQKEILLKMISYFA